MQRRVKNENNKTISFIMIAACVMQTKAEYQVLIKVPDANIIKMVNIAPHTPFIGEWIDKGSLTNCAAWTPLPATVKKVKALFNLLNVSKNRSE